LEIGNTAGLETCATPRCHRSRTDILVVWQSRSKAALILLDFWGRPIRNGLRKRRRIMKASIKFLAQTLLMAAAFRAGAQGVHLNPGESYFFTFSGLAPFVLPDASVKPSDQVSIHLLFGLHSTGGDPLNPDPNWSGDGFGMGEQATVSFFENSTSLTPFFGGPIRGEFSPQGVPGWYGFGPAQRRWTDHEGAVRIRMDSGSMELTAIQVDVTYDGMSFRSAFAVPEPSTMALAVTGVIGTTIWWWRSSRRPRARQRFWR
jgi:hypothetical protein